MASRHKCLHSEHIVFTRSQIAYTADFSCDSDELTFVEFGRDLSEIQAIYQDTGQKTKKKDAAPYVPHIAVTVELKWN